MAEKENNQIHVYLDGEEKPIVSYRPPVRFELDTTLLEDGKHTLKIVASDATGHEGVREVSFEVRNGPGIDIDGLQNNDILEGKVPILLNAYGGAKEPFWEPSRAETPAPIPTLIWVLLIIIVAWSLFFIARTWNPPQEFASTPTYSQFSENGNNTAITSAPASAKGTAGATLYRTSCASCHQANGEGITGVFPPLAGNAVVNSDDSNKHIEVVLYGLQGTTIDGVDYAAAMPPFSEQLSDEEVAAIINHERTNWGNDAPTVTADQVGKVRAAGNPN
jgi:mono/diheme cytochrome c family protein